MFSRVVHTFSWLILFTKNARRKLFVIVILSFFCVTAEIWEVFMLERLINIILAKQLTGILQLLIYFSISIILVVTLNSLLNYCTQRFFCYPVSAGLSNQVLSSVIDMPGDKFREHSNMVYIDVLTQDVFNIASGFASKIRSIYLIVKAVMALIVLSFLDIRILPFTIVYVVAYLWISKVFVKKFVSALSEYLEEVSILHKVTEEGVSASREILAYNCLSWEEERRKREFAVYYKKAKHMYIMGNWQFAATNLLRWGMVLAVLCLGSYFVIKSVISISMFVALYRIFDMFQNVVENLYNEVSDLSKILAAGERVQKLTIGFRHMDGNDKKQHHFSEKIKDITFSNVSYQYPHTEKPVLQDLNFTLKAGSKTAIVGPSGSGKSTIIKLMLTSIRPTEGSIKVNGTDLLHLDTCQWAGVRLAACTQEPYFYAETIEENIRFGNPTSFDIQGLCRQLCLEPFISRQKYGFATIIGDRGITLSGGERQRLALARLLARDIEVYCFDESTSAIDIQTEEIVRRSIDRRTCGAGQTAVHVAHRLETITNADTILVINQGRLEAIGTHMELIERCELYRNMYFQQAHLSYE